MKLFKSLKSWIINEEHLYYLFLLILIVPNIALSITEPLSVWGRIANIAFPLAVYYMVFSRMKNPGKALWWLFLFVFLGAFQIVLLYLFGKSIIAVDMFLNLLTTNSTEAMELLDNMLPAIVIVVLLYVPALALGTYLLIKKKNIEKNKRRRWGYPVVAAGVVSLLAALLFDGEYRIATDLYPVNVCYNIGLAVDRTVRTNNYAKTSADFSFHARATHPKERKEIYVMVVGETSRAANWQLMGYERETNPLLMNKKGVYPFTHVLSESNTTHKSVPMLISPISAIDYDSIYYKKGVLEAFNEAGFETSFFSNQRPNHSFIDFFGEQAQKHLFIKEMNDSPTYNPSDEQLLGYVEKALQSGANKQFIVLHTYGSHFNYRERYPKEEAFFKPDYPVEAEVKYAKNLMNAYDNSIRETDRLLSRLIDMLESKGVDAAVMYTSDHGEDIFDDSRRLFLHASPVPSYYQIHVPMIVWMSSAYAEHYPEAAEVALRNRDKKISSSASFFYTMIDLAGLSIAGNKPEWSFVNEHFKERPFVYLNDHNEDRPIDKVGMGKEDFALLKAKGILE